MSKDYKIILKDIVTEIEETQEFVLEMSFDDFLADRKTQKAAIRGLEIIGEAMNRLPREWQTKHPEILWKEWIDFRNILIHVYHGIDLSIVWDTIMNELPYLKKHITSIIRLLEAT